MQDRVLRWIPVVLFLLLAMLGYAVRAKNAAQTPCRRSPEICQPQQEPPPCQPMLCPDADRR